MESTQALQAALELSMLNLNNTTYSTASPDPPFGLLEDEMPIDIKAKSQNITQYVPVPSSEHVAEIVGRQGCKVKALRAKTNTYIKTPVRGEEPVFIVTGRPEDVASANREILSASDHFSKIRARRASAHNPPPPPEAYSNGLSCSDDNRITILVRVPYRVVGLVVGPKGATVKRIQQLTSTYIVTPSRDKEPAFEVRGLPDNVERARIEIESYIALRTGGSADTPDSPPEPDYFSPMSLSGPDPYNSPSTTNHLSRRMSESSRPGMHMMGEHSFIRPDERRLSPMSNAVFSGSQEQDHFINMPMSAPAAPSDRAFDFSTFNDALMYINPPPQQMPINVNASRDINFPGKSQPPSPTYSWESGSSDGLSMSSPKQKSQMLFRNGHPSSSCCVCNDKEVVAALIPCGHNLFCMSCANYIADFIHRCPVCDTQVNNALRIHSR